MTSNNNIPNTTSNIRKNKPIPFLELSASTLSNLDEDSVDFENVLSVWTGLTKSSLYVKNGKRLENLSWRVINRNLVSKNRISTQLSQLSQLSTSLQISSNDFRTLIQISSSKTTRQPFLDELDTATNVHHGKDHHRVSYNHKKKSASSLQRPKSRESYQSLLNHQRNSSNSSSHRSSQDLKQHGRSISPAAPPPKVQPVVKRPANPRQVSEISIQNVGTEITEEVSSSEEDDEGSHGQNRSQQSNGNRDQNRNQLFNGQGNDQHRNQHHNGHHLNQEEEENLKFQQPEPHFVSELFKKNFNSSKSNESIVTASNGDSSSNNLYEVEEIERTKKINEELQNEKPPMLRSNTSTSIVRGFSPNNVSVSYVNISKAKDELPRVSSLFGGKKQQQIPQAQQQQLPQQQQQQQQQQSQSSQSQLPQSHKVEPEKSSLPPVSSLFGPKHASRSPLSHTPPDAMPPVSSLFGQKLDHKGAIEKVDRKPEPQPTVASLFSSKPQQSQQSQQSHQAHAQSQPHQAHAQSQSHQAHAQSQSNPLLAHPHLQQLPHKGKKQNLLNNLGMTSLHGSNLTPSAIKDPNNMFFIESSPSPLESDIVGSIDKITLDAVVKPERRRNHSTVASSTHSITHPNHQQSFRLSPTTETQVPEENSTIHQSNTSLFQHQSKPNVQLIYSSDSYSDDSEWSSMSDDQSESGSDVEETKKTKEQKWLEESLNFAKKEDQSKKPAIKRSLLSGLFLNEMVQGKEEVQLLRSSTTGDLKKSGGAGAPNAVPVAANGANANANGVNANANVNANPVAQQHVIESKSSLEISSSFHHHQRKASSVTPAQTKINALLSVTSPPANLLLKPALQRQSSSHSVTNGQAVYGSSVDKKLLQSSLSRMMSKSALNLTSYFVNSRRPSSAGVPGSTHGSTHQSNAPPTAATLLPTALLTHMFLPNVHQRARSKLSAVVETRDDLEPTSSGGSSVRSTSTGVRKASQPTLIPQQSRTSSFGSALDLGMRNNNTSSTGLATNKVIPGEKLSPRLSHKLMLATELSESLRTSMLSDRKLTSVQLSNGVDERIGDVRHAPEVTNMDDSSISDVEDIEGNGILDGDFHIGSRPIKSIGHESFEGSRHSSLVGKRDAMDNGNGNSNDKNMRSLLPVDGQWDEDNELDYHTKGW